MQQTSVNLTKFRNIMLLNLCYNLKKFNFLKNIKN